MFNLHRNASGSQTGRLWLSCFVCLFCSLIAFAFPQAQQRPQQQISSTQQMPSFKVQTSLVVVDVTVRDRQGNLVGDLKKGDFKIYEDNVLQDIAIYTLENIPIGQTGGANAPVATPPVATPAAKPPATAPPATAPPATTPPATTPPATTPPATTPPVTTPPATTPPATTPPPTAATATATAKPKIINLTTTPDVKAEELAGKRMVILFFDLSSSQTEDLIRSVESAKTFVTKEAGPQDLVAIATFSSTLQLLQDLTNDQKVLLQILNGLVSTESGDAATEDLSDTTTSDDTFVPDTTQFNIFNTDRRMMAIETIAKMYRDFPEKKALLYFSGGVTTTGVENNAQIRSTVDNANRSNMQIYPVDTRGLVAMAPGGNASQASPGGRGMYSGSSMTRQMSDLASSQETLTTLSHDTGGALFQDSNNMSLAYHKVQEDTRIYYVLGYYSSNAREDGKYRKIRVEVSRPDVKLEHRPGYFASKAFAQLNQQERDLQLQQALAVDVPFDEVPFILQADCFHNDNTTNLVPLSIELKGDGIQFADKGTQKLGQFEVIAEATDSKGNVKALARDNVQVRLPADSAEKIRAGGILYSNGFQLRPGDYKLKMIVRDNGNGKIGSFEQAIAVPVMDGKSLQTSTVVLGNRLLNAQDAAGVIHQGSMRRLQGVGGSGFDPMVIEGKKIVPSIGNVFVARQTVYVYFQVYGAAPEQPSGKPSIETDLLLLREKTKILQSEPQLVQEWTKAPAPAFGGRGLGGFGGFGGGPPPGGGPGAGGAGSTATVERKGEATVAISLPLKGLRKGTYTLQIHVRDTVSDVNLFLRVPVVIQ
jgi:VWFA-related protein